jgi:cob(I)alamin adenosyltransferase
MPKYFTGKGDDGYTGLLGKERVPKYHPRPETYGLIDEASASLGLARSLVDDEIGEVLKTVQRDLYAIMSEVAATSDHAAEFQGLEQERVQWIEGEIDRYADQIHIPRDFVIFGDSMAEAALDVARTQVRHAERAVARLQHEGELDNQLVLIYLNRLSSLCFVLAMWQNASTEPSGPTLSKTE